MATRTIPHAGHVGGDSPRPKSLPVVPDDSGYDDPDAGAAPPLPAEPVGFVEGAVALIAGPVAADRDTLRMTLDAAGRCAPRLAGSGFAGGTVRVCDAAGNEWGREAIPAASRPAA
jgi:hypothetical protein